MNLLENIILNVNNLGEFNEYLKNIQNEKSIPYKLSILEFIQLALGKTFINTLKLFAKDLSDILYILTEDASQEVRNLALACLALIKVRLKENFNFNKISEISDLKKNKLEELCKNIEYDKSYDNVEIKEDDLSETKRKKEYLNQRKCITATKSTPEVEKNMMTNSNFNETMKSGIGLELITDDLMKKMYETEIISYKDTINKIEEKAVNKEEKKEEKEEEKEKEDEKKEEKKDENKNEKKR